MNTTLSLLFHKNAMVEKEDTEIQTSKSAIYCILTYKNT